MTLGDLLAGRWTVWQLVASLSPVLAVSVSSFFAGYWHGRNVEALDILKRLAERPPAERQD